MRKDLRTRLLLLLAGVVLAFCGRPATAESADSPWGGDYFPNVTLTTHEGKSVRFFDDLIKDKVVAINFIFTSCPDACPLETARLREVQKILGDKAGKDVFIYSITIDPDNDTPDVLKRYAERFEAGPGWLFLTGDKADIELLRRKLGLLGEDDDGSNLSAHNLSLVIGNQKTGRWMKGSPFENPYFMATQLAGDLHNWKTPPPSGRDYANAPEVRPIPRGESLFRTRCASCHSIGKDGPSTKRAVGPDLAGVTQLRDRAWLIRFIAEPDKMLAEKDPQAMALLAAYNNVAMPNLRLTSVDTEALLSYIEGESQRMERIAHGHGADHRGHATAPMPPMPSEEELQKAERSAAQEREAHRHGDATPPAPPVLNP